MASKLVYSEIMNRWLYGAEIDNQQKTSQIFKEGYDDPTYMTFKIEFGDWGASILDRDVLQTGSIGIGQSNDYDMLPIGLLNCPYEGSPNDDEYWQNSAENNYKVFNNTKFYSAFQYLRSRNEDTRAKYLYYFVNGLYEIQHDYPFLFKKISGINSLESFNPKDGQRLKTPAKITVECYEGLDLKIRTLFEFYRKAAWDDVYQRWILPENMREFKMIIYIFERRIFQDIEGIYVTDNGIQKKQGLVKYGKLNGDIPVKAYECCPCEFDIAQSMSWGNDYSSSVENGEETSKLNITVKNVKTYYKNGLLKTDLAKSYNKKNDGKMESRDLASKVEYIMIYDLVDSIDRQTDTAYLDQTDTDNSTKIRYQNLSAEAAKGLFLNKNILLENEEANENYRAYIWGYSYGGNVLNENDYENAVSKAKNKMQMQIEDNTSYRGGWVLSGSLPSYDSNKSFWGNLGDNIKNIFTGARRQMMLSGAATIHLIDNCLTNSFSIPSYTYQSILKSNRIKYTNSLIGNLSKSISAINQKGLHKLENLPEIAQTDAFNELLDSPEKPKYAIHQLESNDSSTKQDFIKIEDGRDIPEYEFSSLSQERYISEHEFGELSKERNMPKYEFAELAPERSIQKQEFGHIENERTLDQQKFKELDKERIPGQTDFIEIENERTPDNQKFKELDNERKPDQQKFKELESERIPVQQKFKNLENERELNKQQYLELSKIRETDNEILELLANVRSLPGFSNISIEDVRDLPKYDFANLKEAVERSIPKYKIDKSVLLDQIEKMNGTNMTLLELDNDNKQIENEIIKALQTNKALEDFKPLDTSTTNNKLNNLRKTTAFIKDFSDNAQKIKKAYVTNILSIKDKLENVTRNIINQLPLQDTYIFKNGEKHENINSALMSQNDIDQINQNIAFLAINNNDIEKLSFQSLITIQENMSNALKKSEATVGLTAITKNSKATSTNKIKNPSKSILEEPKKDKMNVIY